MRKKVLFMSALLSVFFVFSSCKSKQQLVSIPTAEDEIIESTETYEPTVEVAEEYSPKVNEETFTLEDGQNNSFYKKFHVVVGSFSVKDNAVNLKNTLVREGNDAIVVKNASNMYRVIISSYDSYDNAHIKIRSIANRFGDAWVLRQK